MKPSKKKKGKKDYIRSDFSGRCMQYFHDDAMLDEVGLDMYTLLFCLFRRVSLSVGESASSLCI
jgi:hypothetical protein